MFPVEREEITYKRKKAKGKRQALLAQFDSEEVHHRLEDCFCPDCQGELKEIGASFQRQELVFIPAQLKRVDHIQHSYKCQACSKNNPSDKIVKTPALNGRLLCLVAAPVSFTGFKTRESY